MSSLHEVDPLLASFIDKEAKRQSEHLELIASENYASKAVIEAVGSILTNKYAEGYPHKRYYGGCFWVDEVEKLAIERVCRLFGCRYANVQPHSGSQANMAAYRAILEPKSTILALKLSDGGHLTHGHHLSFSGMEYNFIPYELNVETETIDYDKLRKLAFEVKPQAILAGASAYSRIIDFALIKSICQEVNCYFIVDMAHIAGLVAANLHPNPCLYADIVTSTTHKTLRGPRGGIILSNDIEIAKKIDKAVFPGIQGGPLMHVIAGKAVAFKEALEPSFKEYMKQVVSNTKAFAKAFVDLGYHVVSGGSDNHMFLVDVYSKTKLTGLIAEQLLDSVNITVNKNTIPNDTQKPFITSGIRIGTPALTTRGMKESDMKQIALLINRVLTNPTPEVKQSVLEEVSDLASRYPLWY